MLELSLERLLNSCRRADTLCFAGIMLLAAFLRLSHLDIAHFQLDQSLAAKFVWEIARDGKLHTHFNPVTGGYNNFPLALYLWTPPFLFSDHIHSLLVWNMLLGLISLAACWFVVERCWSWRAAALATLLFATQPWQVWYAHRLWPNMLMSPFVAFWFIGIVFAFHESRRRYWALAWGMAILLIQLHASGAIFLIANGILWLTARRDQPSWRGLTLGVGLALIPALPWFGSLIGGDALIQTQRLPLIGEGKAGLAYNPRPLIDFFTADNWRHWFHGADKTSLDAIFRPLELAAAPLMIALAASAAVVLRATWRGPNRRLHAILALWICLPMLFFPLVSIEVHALVYYAPMLPAPFIALALAWQSLPPMPRRLAAVAVILLCAAQGLAVLGSAQFIRASIENGDETVWAVGGGAPLSTQLALARMANELVEAGAATEIIHFIRPVLSLWHETMAYALPLLSGAPTRHLDHGAGTLVFPQDASLWALDSRNTALPAAVPAEAVGRSGPFRLYRLPGADAPAPLFSFAQLPAFANGLQLLGYDALRCDGGWKLHWQSEVPASDAPPEHFFVHLLDADGRVLAQRDLRAFDPQQRKPGDRFLTAFDFEASLRGLPIEVIRVGLYRFSHEADAGVESIYALDENGMPWEYAVDIAWPQPCQP